MLVSATYTWHNAPMVTTSVGLGLYMFAFGHTHSIMYVWLAATCLLLLQSCACQWHPCLPITNTSMSSAFRLFICTQVLSVPCDVLLLLQLPSAQARSWGAAEEWLGWEDFRQQLHSQPYAPMLHCDSWKVRRLLALFALLPLLYGRLRMF